MDNGVQISPDTTNCRTVRDLADDLNVLNVTPILDVESVTCMAGTGKLVGDTHLHPYEYALAMQRKMEENPTETPNASEVGQLCALVKLLEENHQKTCEFMKRLEVAYAQSCGHLDKRIDELMLQISRLEVDKSALEKRVDGTIKNMSAQDSTVGDCKRRLLALEISQKTPTATTPPVFDLANDETPKGPSYKRRLTDNIQNQGKVAKTAVQPGQCTIPPTPAPGQMANTKPAPQDDSDIVISLTDPSDPFGGYFAWRVKLDGIKFDCILTAMIYAEAKSTTTHTLTSMATNLHQLYAKLARGKDFDPAFHEFQRGARRIWGLVRKHVMDHSLDVANSWFKSDSGRETEPFGLYPSLEAAKETVAYETLKAIIQNAVDCNTAFRQLLWSSGQKKVDSAYVKTNRQIRCAGEIPASGWRGALMCGANKGRYECALPTKDGAYYMAPFMNLYGEALMEVRAKISKVMAFSRRASNGELVPIEDGEMFLQYDSEGHFDGMDRKKVYAKLQEKLLAPESYKAEARRIAALRNGWQNTEQQPPVQQDAQVTQPSQNVQRGRGYSGYRGRQPYNARGRARGQFLAQRGSFAGRGIGPNIQGPRTAYDLTQDVLQFEPEPLTEARMGVELGQASTGAISQGSLSSAAANVGGVNAQQLSNILAQQQTQQRQQLVNEDIVSDDDDFDNMPNAVTATIATAARAGDNSYSGVAQARTRDRELSRSIHCRQLLLSHLEKQNAAKCAKSLGNFLQSHAYYPEDTMIRDKAFGSKCHAINGIVRLLHTGINMGPQCGFRPSDHTPATNLKIVLPIETMSDPYAYFYTVLIIGDSTSSSLYNMLSRDCASAQVPVTVHGSKGLFSGRRMSTFCAGIHDVKFTTVYDMVILRSVLNACDAELFDACLFDARGVDLFFSGWCKKKC